MMCFNAGLEDRTIRVVGGICLIAAGIMTQNYILSAIGAVPLITGAIGLCPLYTILRVNTGCTKK